MKQPDAELGALKYEIKMLTKCAELYVEVAVKLGYSVYADSTSGTPAITLSHGDPSKKDAFLEAFLVHARLLGEFAADKGRPSDIQVSGFVLDPVQWKNRADAWWHNDFQKHKDSMDKWLAHLTKARAMPPKQQWDIPEIARVLADILDSFLAAARSDRIDAQNKTKLKEFVRRLRNLSGGVSSQRVFAAGSP